MQRVMALAFVALLAGCSSPREDSRGTQEQTSAALATAPVRFLAIGDMGTGDDNQRRVADAMDATCADLGCDFVIGLGDNIYEAGVTSPYDPQFTLKFEQPYAAFAIPFHMTLGNHDNLGVRSGHAGGDFQVMYAARTDRAMDLWTMPARWYAHEQGPVRFLALDTNVVFASQTETPAVAGLLTRDVDGQVQLAWLRETLATPVPAGTWTILYGHHPLFSNGEHGDSAIESPQLGAWLQDAVCTSGAVDLLVTGHDHDLQWLEAQPAKCGRTEFVVSGAAAQTRPIQATPNPAYLACGDTLGYTWFEVHGERLVGRVFDASGQLLFERVLDRADPDAATATAFTERTASCSP